MSTALVVVHEGRGPDRHAHRLAAAVRRPEWTVSVPDLRPVLAAGAGRAAGVGTSVGTSVGTDAEPGAGTGAVALAAALAAHAAALRADHDRLLCLGFSAGATAAWLAAEAFDAIACVCCARLHDHADHRPRRPCLLVVAARGPGPAPRDLAGRLAGPTVAVDVYDAEDGFCDEDDPRHHPEHSAAVVRGVRRFFHADR